MIEAQYSVIRYMADPARGERLNLGVLLWTEGAYRLAVDPSAAERVIRENPRLERDGLLYVEPLLRDTLGRAPGEEVGERVRGVLDRQKGFPIDLTEPRFTSLVSDDLEEPLEALVKRIVYPKRRGGGGGHDPTRDVEQRLRPLLTRGAVERHRFFQASRSGVSRVADFYANSNVNTALDVVRLAVKKADEIRHRADAEAYKVHDVLEKNAVRYAVYCVFSDDRALKETNESVVQILGSAGASVITDIDGAVLTMQGT